jgi:RNA polymerase sigma-70 factor, ECF subfamily
MPVAAPAPPATSLAGPIAAAAALDRSDEGLVAALRERDEDAYLTLVRRHTPLMLHVARGYVTRRDVAEDVVQDAWLAVLRGVDSFEGRSTFKTWLMRILVNTARTRRRQENRTVCWSSTPGDAQAWETLLFDRAATADVEPEPRSLQREAWMVIRDALDELAERQRTVVVLRDVEGWGSDEVQAALDLSPGNQRVLLHRGRARLRALLAPHL